MLNMKRKEREKRGRVSGSHGGLRRERMRFLNLVDSTLEKKGEKIKELAVDAS